MNVTSISTPPEPEMPGYTIFQDGLDLRVVVATPTRILQLMTIENFVGQGNGVQSFHKDCRTVKPKDTAVTSGTYWEGSRTIESIKSASSGLDRLNSVSCRVQSKYNAS